MKTLLIFVLLATWGTFAAWAQVLPGSYLPVLHERPLKRIHMIGSTTHEPLLLLAGQETDYASLLVDPKEIMVIKAFKDSAILAPLGHKARHGVYQVELKTQKTLLKLEDVLDYFQVPPAQRQLKVLVNRRPVNPTRFLADVKRISKIEVVKQDKISPMRLSWDENEQFLNIVTVP